MAVYIVKLSDGTSTIVSVADDDTESPIERCKLHVGEKFLDVEIYSGSTVALQDAKSMKDYELTNACSMDISSTFSSSATGIALTYPNDDVSQRNLAIAVACSLASASEDWSTHFKCSDGTSWKMVEHSAKQIQAVGEDSRKWIVFNQGKLDTLRSILWDVSMDSEEKVASLTWNV